MKKILATLCLAAVVAMPTAYVTASGVHADNQQHPCQKNHPGKICGS
jgi:hypothetical protein